jgi:hypothetical protein
MERSGTVLDYLLENSTSKESCKFNFNYSSVRVTCGTVEFVLALSNLGYKIIIIVWKGIE